MKKLGFSLPDHQACGRTLYAARETLGRLGVWLANTYRQAPAARVWAVQRRLDQVRCTLDSYVFREYSAIERLAKIGVYYPGDGLPAIPRDWDLARACTALRTLGAEVEHWVNPLLAAYAVALGDRVIRIVNDLESLATELPYLVGPPKRRALTRAL